MKYFHHKQAGFTIIELMITLIVAAVVLAIGVPNFQTIIRTNQASADVNNLVTALNLARSEAVVRSTEVTVMPASGGSWGNGWVVGVDTDEDNVFPEPGEPVFRTFQAVNGLSFTANPTSVAFKPNGEAVALASFAMVPSYCHDSMNKQRVLNVALAGYVELQTRNCP